MRRAGTTGIAWAVWLGLSLLYIPLTRSMQPSLPMTILAVAILMGASALLLLYGTHVWRRGRHRAALLAIGALTAGVGAALLIRLCYTLFAPDVTPFGLPFNIAADLAWTSVHALAVGALLHAVGRRRRVHQGD